MAIIRIQDPKALANPTLLAFLLEATQAVKIPNLEPAVAFIATQIHFPGCGVWVGAEGGKLRAILVAFWPGNPLMLAPQICVAYNKGSRTLSRELGEAVKAWVREGGYDRILTVNTSGHSDEAHMRAYRYVGKPTRLGGQVEYRLE